MRVKRLLIAVVLLFGLGATLIRVCADGGAMAAAYQSCECYGLEWEIYDQTAADGPRRTLCLGWMRSRTCYQFRDGPVVGCSE